VVLVCSAFSGVTDLLERWLTALRSDDTVAQDVHEAALVDRHRTMAEPSGVSTSERWKAALEAACTTLAMVREGGPVVSASDEARVLGLGELLSTRFGEIWLTSHGEPASWVDARDCLVARSPDAGDVDPSWVLSAEIDIDASRAPTMAKMCSDVIVTQGYILHTVERTPAVLGRGGSDTSAAAFGALIDARAVEIWTDVPGTFTTNPRDVGASRLLRRVGIGEVSTMAAHGAKVLHPRSLEVVRQTGVPMHIKWTAAPNTAEGTMITTSELELSGVRAVTCRSHVCAVSVERTPRWQPVGFMADVAEGFRRHRISMDMIVSSPSAIRATVDMQAFPYAYDHLAALSKELGEEHRVTIDRDVACVSLVGTHVSVDLTRVAPALLMLDPSDLLFVCHGAEDGHISFIVRASVADRLVRALHHDLFEADALDPDVFGPTWAQLTTTRKDAQPQSAVSKLLRRPPMSSVEAP